MTTEEFVQALYRDKQDLLNFYLDADSGAAGTRLLQQLQMPPEGLAALRDVLDTVMINVYYSVLLGLEGSASLGGTQARYELRDAAGNSLNDGDLGGYAWQYFQNDGQEEE